MLTFSAAATDDIPSIQAGNPSGLCGADEYEWLSIRPECDNLPRIPSAKIHPAFAFKIFEPYAADLLLLSPIHPLGPLLPSVVRNVALEKSTVLQVSGDAPIVCIVPIRHISCGFALLGPVEFARIWWW